MTSFNARGCLLALLLSGAAAASAAQEQPGPFDLQVAKHQAALRAESAATRRRAAESLGFLRARGGGRSGSRARRP